jgi:hypothetical protein
MRPDSVLLATLGSVRDRLIHPTPANLDACVPELERCVEELRRVTGSSQARGIPRQLAALTRQITELHRQAGRICFGAARVGLAGAAGYTAAGEAPAPAAHPHVTITG